MKTTKQDREKLRAISKRKFTRDILDDLDTMEENGWNKSKTARSLQISLTTIKIMIREMKSFGVVPKVSHSCNPRLLKGRDGKFIGFRQNSI